MNYKKFVHLDSEGNSWGIVATEQLWANVYALKCNRHERKLSPDIWKSLFRKACSAARELRAEDIEIRIRLEYEAELFRAPFKELGFKRKAGRIEYQCDVEKSEDFIQDWLHHDEFTSGTDCISIGFANGEPCALSVVQVESKTGWSRIRSA